VVLEYADRHEAPLDGDVACDASVTMQNWLPLVRAMPRWAHDDGTSAALVGLARWYERLCADLEYAAPPPLDGLDTLVEELITIPACQTLRQLGLARWAIRVGEELVQWRACLAAKSAPAKVSMARNRLDLALRSARRHFNAEPNSFANRQDGAGP
jgi:hypothetical protein